MIEQPPNKSVRTGLFKRADTEPVDIDIGAQRYPASEGWQPVTNRLGLRVGFYRDADGYKDDPALMFVPRRPVNEFIDNDPAVIAARAADAEAEAAYQTALARWQEAVAGQAERAIKRVRDMQRGAPPGAVIVDRNGAGWTDTAVDVTVEDRLEAERKVWRTRPAVSAAEAAARARWQPGSR